jgi:hypothetical protein
MWHSTPSVLTAMLFKLFAMETTLHRLRAVSKNPHRSLQSAARKGQNFERSILKYLLNFVVKKINQLTTIFNSFASALFQFGTLGTLGTHAQGGTPLYIKQKIKYKISMYLHILFFYN